MASTTAVATATTTAATSTSALSPVFSAITSSPRPLYLLLKCIGFLSRAQVQISAEGIRMSVEDSKVMQGHAFLGKHLFATYEFNPPNRPRQPRHPSANLDSSNQEDSDDDEPVVTFEISLSALLECLQIFGSDSKGGDSKYGNPSTGSGISAAIGALSGERAAGGGLLLNQQVLRINGGTCRLVYRGHGYPLSLILSESKITTTCDLVTYEATEPYDDIPLQRDSLAKKIIMKARWLHDAVQELESNLSPEKLVITASPRAPYFSLSSVGAMGSTIVEFSRHILETFQVSEQTANTYKFSLIRNASKAMEVATKVSIRGDSVGVLSLQFMIHTSMDGTPNSTPSFIDYRFLPFESDEDASDMEMETEI